jgi:hypothetical protein
MLWSWFGDDDFRPLADAGIGIAYRGLSLTLEGRNEVFPDPRTVPVRIPAKTYQMLVVRIDYSSEGARRPSFSQRQRQLAAQMVAEIADLGRPQAVQIDFDAPRTARPFYRQLLGELRERLGPDVFLSVTALVSWCDTEQSWLSGLPVDEIVPMAFSMGQATAAITTLLQRGGQLGFPGCRGSIGVQLGGEFRPRKGQRAYFFPGPQRWSPEAVSSARRAILP